MTTICGAKPARDVTLISSKANCGWGGRLGVDPGVVVAVIDCVTVGVTLVRAIPAGSGWGVLTGCTGGGISCLLIDNCGSNVTSLFASFKYVLGFKSYKAKLLIIYNSIFMA